MMPAAAQRGYFLRVVARDVTQQAFRMFTERGRAGVGRLGWFCGLARGFERRAGDDKPVKAGMLGVQDHLARFEMRIAG